MKNFVPLDPGSHVSQEHWAVVYVPRRSRNRFAANCVHVFANQDEALKQSVPKEHQFAVKIFRGTVNLLSHSLPKPVSMIKPHDALLTRSGRIQF